MAISLCPVMIGQYEQSNYPHLSQVVKSGKDYIKTFLAEKLRKLQSGEEEKLQNMDNMPLCFARIW